MVWTPARFGSPRARVISLGVATALVTSSRIAECGSCSLSAAWQFSTKPSFSNIALAPEQLLRSKSRTLSLQSQLLAIYRRALSFSGRISPGHFDQLGGVLSRVLAIARLRRRLSRPIQGGQFSLSTAL